MPPTIPINHYLSPLETNKIEPRSYLIIPCCMYSRRCACLKHSNFLKVKVLDTCTHTVKCRLLGSPRRCPGRSQDAQLHRSGPVVQAESKAEIQLRAFFFNRNNFNIRYWSWNYRGCWHQTCPPIDTLQEGFKFLLIPITKTM